MNEPEGPPAEEGHEGQPALVSRFREIGIAQLNTEEILALNYLVSAAANRELQEYREAIARGQEPEFMQTAAQRLQGAATLALTQLLRDDAKRRTPVAVALQESEHVENRATLAVLIQEFARSDPVAALPLWERLLEDPDGDVRACAYDSLINVADEIPEVGDVLTLAQVAPLIRTYQSEL